jgi:predicted SAM-dependent methyltransferase
MLSAGRRWLRNVRERYRHVLGVWRLRRAARRSPIRLVVGASGIAPVGWITTEASFLDLTRPHTWRRFLAEHSVDAILAEHVWEHLSDADGLQAALTCHRFLRPHGRLRIAVPDGNHPSPDYIDAVRPGGNGPGADDHKQLYTLTSLTSLLEKAGFRAVPLEWFDERHAFHANEWDPADGFVRRSRRFDARNADGRLAYTSLIVDAFPS